MDPKPMILIVDDDLYVRDLLTRYIEHIGYRSMQCEGADEAFAVLDRPGRAGVDLVLTDIQMPKVSGLEMLNRLHETDPDLPIAIITGVPTLDNSIAALNSGAYAFIVKPIQIAEVKGVIDKGLALVQKTRNRAALEEQLEARYRTLEAELVQIQGAHPQEGDAIADLIRGLRHEIGNAATAIKLNLSVLERESGSSAQFQEHLKDLESSADELSGLVARLRQYPGGQPKQEPVNLKQVMAAVTESVQRKIDANRLTLKVSLPDEDVWVSGGSSELTRTCLHILDNAIEADLASGEREVRLGLEADDEGATIHISDAGPGFPSDLLAAMFSPGYTTKMTDGFLHGLGLGLFIARTTVNLYGGQIRLDNNCPAPGATVTIWLPRAER